ncbi:MAG: PilZ domain-containing protein [Pseudomonadota bacterium]
MGIWENLPEDKRELPASEHDNRNDHRDALFMLAKIQFVKSGKMIDARIRNLSSGGMMAESNVFCAAGDRVIVDMVNAEEIEGRISWQTSGRFGIAFDHPVDPQTIRAARNKKSDTLIEKPSHLRLMEKKAANSAKRVRRI